ncbi:MAG TPA: NAD(P)-dependent alcohol dehydrogenase [Caulobacteraceae bacterium]|nr:NAD(P)-dependent alcohol dehydrogenase [Caulobacteraceae bacterium]
MRAIQIRQPASLQNLHLAELAEPAPPGKGEITVRLHATSLNYHDYAVVIGAIKTPEGRIPMSDGAGVVEAVGEGVAEFAVGDAVVSTFFPDWLDGEIGDRGFTRVPGDGIDGYARERVTAEATAFTRVPAGYSHAEAATLTCAGVTAWRALVPNGGLKAGETVLVQGSGGVSVFALQFAKAMGATVVATSSSDEKLERMKALGADHLINYKSEPNWGAAVRKLTDGRGVDHVVEIGGAGTMPESITAARVGGHISVIGVLAGVAGPIPTVLIMAKNLRVIGLTVGSRRHQLDMIRAIEANAIRPVIDKSFPLEGLADAFRHQESNRHFGKIVCEY